jgi:hypothetical protein
MLLVVPTTTRVSSERKLQKLGIEVGGYHVVRRVVADEEGDPEETQFVLSANAWCVPRLDGASFPKV